METNESSNKPAPSHLSAMSTLYDGHAKGGSSSSSVSPEWDNKDYEEIEGEEDVLDTILDTICKSSNITIFEPEDSTNERKKTMEEVKKLTTKWIRQCLRVHKCLSPEEIEQSNSHLRAFGSFELNVHFGDSDIDLLCIGPKHVTRDMLFKDFVEMLEADDRVKNILQLRHAFVPLLKFTFHGIDIDLVYAQWNVDVISDDINIFSRKFVGDQDSLLCLNGVRSTETIRQLIPNKEVFEKALRIIKFWAQQRCIYSNVMGFLGGISWSIMTAKVCIDHPDATNCVEVLKRFFAKYTKWDKEDRDDDESGARSIRLRPELYEHLYADDEGDVGVSEYQRNVHTEIMPILTPARPAMNCAYNVIGSTKHLIMQEMARGYDITSNGHLAVDDGGINWELLFQRRQFWAETAKTPLMEHYDGEDVYIRVECIHDAEMRYARKWTGYIESNVRKLVKKLNRELFDSTFYPFATAFKCGHTNSDNFFISGKYNVDFDHKQNNEDTINMVLAHFKDRIDSSSVFYQCSGCSMQLIVYHNQQIQPILHQLRYQNGTPVVVADAKDNANVVPPPHGGAPVYYINQLQFISIAPQLPTPTIPAVIPFPAPYAVAAPPLPPHANGGGPMRGHSAAGPYGHRGSRGRGHSHPNGPPPPHGGPHSVHGTHGMRHHHRDSHSVHHPPTHDRNGRRIRPQHPPHHPRSRGGGPMRGARRGAFRHASRPHNFPPPPRHARQMKMMNPHNGGGGRYPAFNGGHGHGGSSMVSTPKSTKDSLSDSPAPAALSKSRQSSFNSHDSDSNESSGSAEGNGTSGRTHSGAYNGNHDMSRGPSPHPPSTPTGVTDSSRGLSPAPSLPQQGTVPPVNGFRNVMFPPHTNISSFPILKIEAPSLPHVSPVVSYSNGSTPEHPGSANAAAPPSNGNGQTPPSARPGVNHYNSPPVYAWVFVPIMPNFPHPPSNAG